MIETNYTRWEYNNFISARIVSNSVHWQWGERSGSWQIPDSATKPADIFYLFDKAAPYSLITNTDHFLVTNPVYSAMQKTNINTTNALPPGYLDRIVGMTNQLYATNARAFIIPPLRHQPWYEEPAPMGIVIALFLITSLVIALLAVLEGRR